MAFSGILFLSEGKFSKAAPKPMNSATKVSITSSIKSNLDFSMDWTDGAGSTSAGIPKRKISDVSGNNAGPILLKRQRVEWSSHLSGILKTKSPDIWMLKTKDEDSESILTSYGRPVFQSMISKNYLYEIEKSDGNKSIVRVTASGSTGWYQNQDIVWTDKKD